MTTNQLTLLRFTVIMITFSVVVACVAVAVMASKIKELKKAVKLAEANTAIQKQQNRDLSALIDSIKVANS